jgi:hypothetical protein
VSGKAIIAACSPIHLSQAQMPKEHMLIAENLPKKYHTYLYDHRAPQFPVEVRRNHRLGIDYMNSRSRRIFLQVLHYIQKYSIQVKNNTLNKLYSVPWYEQICP